MNLFHNNSNIIQIHSINCDEIMGIEGCVVELMSEIGRCLFY